MTKSGFPSFLRDAWLLAKPYFRSEERRTAWLLLISIVAMNLMLVGMDVVLNYWNGAFYDSLQNKDWNAFIGLLLFYHPAPNGIAGIMPGFVLIAAPYILIAIYKTYLTQGLEMRWRRWLTGRFLDRWLADRAYYRISLGYGVEGDAGTENPDQRIAEDLRDFVGSQTASGILSLGLDLFSNVISLFAFLHILWSLSGAVHLFGLTIPGYMVWAAVFYALVGSLLIHLVGKRLAPLYFQQQRFEANFRFGLMRLRESAEGIAIQQGEKAERAALQSHFAHIIANWWDIMRCTKAVNALTSGYQQIAVIFPFLVGAPRYFAGKIPLGGLTRISSAFGQVQSALSWLVSSYSSVMTWRATVERLGAFQRALDDAQSPANARLESASGTQWGFNDLTIRLPDGRVLLDGQTLSLPDAAITRLVGRSGSGKSTLLRALAGVWPFGEGRINRPKGRALFLPQKSYFPIGSLRDVLTYPDHDPAFTDQRLTTALQAAGLGALVTRLDDAGDWAKRLSGGEQQRLAIARVLVLQPDYLFMDEATAHLERAAEAEILRVLRHALPGLRIVLTTHRDPPEGTENFNPWGPSGLG